MGGTERAKAHTAVPMHVLRVGQKPVCITAISTDLVDCTSLHEGSRPSDMCRRILSERMPDACECTPSQHREEERWW